MPFEKSPHSYDSEGRSSLEFSIGTYGGTLTLAADLTPANFPDGWFKIGTVKLPVFPKFATPELTVIYHGGDPAADAVIVLENP
jgi:hypothetical protein